MLGGKGRFVWKERWGWKNNFKKIQNNNKMGKRLWEGIKKIERIIFRIEIRLLEKKRGGLNYETEKTQKITHEFLLIIFKFFYPSKFKCNV